MQIYFKGFQKKLFWEKNLEIFQEFLLKNYTYLIETNLFFLHFLCNLNSFSVNEVATIKKVKVSKDKKNWLCLKNRTFLKRLKNWEIKRE